MSYPNTVLVELDEVDGASCGTITGRAELQSGISPPQYDMLSGGDFAVLRLNQVTLSNGDKTWDLLIYYANMGSSCAGFHSMRRTTNVDDPVGNYCKLSNGTTDCDESQANVRDDD